MDSGLLVDFLQFNSVSLMINSQRMESLAGVFAASVTPSTGTVQWTTDDTINIGHGSEYADTNVKNQSSSSITNVIDVDSWLDVGLGEKSSSICDSSVLLPMRDEMDQLEVSETVDLI